VQAARRVARAAVRHAEIQPAGEQVDEQQHEQRRHERAHVQQCRDAAADGERRHEPRAHEQAAQAGAQQHRADRRDLDEPVGDHQLVGPHELRREAVLGRRVGRGAEAHDDEGRDGMRAREQHEHPGHLDRVHPRHQPRLRERVRERADERREHDIRDDEADLEQRRPPRRHALRLQQRDRDDQQRVVGEAGRELRGEKPQEGARHQAGPSREARICSLGSRLSLPEGSFSSMKPE
jgi:hypothetical protein